MRMEKAELERMLRNADIVEIQMLQARYISELDKDNFEGIYELMAKGHPELTYEIVESGAFIGERVEHLIVGEKKKLQKKAEKRSWVGLQYLWSPRIVISRDGTRARAQWNQLSPHCMPVAPYPGNVHTPTAYWFIGKYDNEYIKVDDEWKILKVHVCAISRTPYEEGWIKQPDCRRMYHPDSGKPDTKPRYYTYHSDAVYSEDDIYSYEPYLPEEGEF